LANQVKNLPADILKEITKTKTDTANKRVIRIAKRTFMPAEPQTLDELKYEGNET
jgi:hypothetical protein